MKVGREVGAAAVLEVSSKLLHEGMARIEVDLDSALVGLRHSFELECQYSNDEDGGRLCRACSGFCRALARASGGVPPANAVPVLLEALDALAARRAAGKPAEAAEAFMVQELLGLANQLSGQALAHQLSGQPMSGEQPGETAASPKGPEERRGKIERLRAADVAIQRLVDVSAKRPIFVTSYTPHQPYPSGAPVLELTQQELLVLQARTVQRIGTELLAGSAEEKRSQREQEAATFFLHRAGRKLRMAGLTERDEAMKALLSMIAAVEKAHARAAEQALASSPKPELTKPEEEESSCLVS